ncbi:MAG: hypothetical protein AB8B53_00320 [Flavobacteriales bacterium]
MKQVQSNDESGQAHPLGAALSSCRMWLGKRVGETQLQRKKIVKDL